MFNHIIVFVTVACCVAVFGYLAYWGWKDVKDHEPKG